MFRTNKDQRYLKLSQPAREDLTWSSTCLMFKDLKRETAVAEHTPFILLLTAHSFCFVAFYLFRGMLPTISFHRKKTNELTGSIVLIFVLIFVMMMVTRNICRAMSHDPLMPRQMLISFMSPNKDEISVGNQLVTNEIRKEFHSRFVKILVISRAFRRGSYSNFDKAIWYKFRQHAIVGF